MFSTLLILSIPISLFGLKLNYDHELFNYILIISTQFLCVANLYFRNKRVQQFLHDIFVYVLTYGLLSSNIFFTKVFSIIMASTMLATRFYYKRCIFLFWNNNRNYDYDFIVISLMIICTVRSSSWLFEKECAVIATISHFLLDKHENSVIKKILK